MIKIKMVLNMLLMAMKDNHLVLSLRVAQQAHSLSQDVITPRASRVCGTTGRPNRRRVAVVG